MVRTDLNISSLGSKFVDIRDSIPGDSFNWSWVRPLSEVKYLAIHHSASPDNQTSLEIANYHINNNDWGGIGYHFVITKDGTVYYVGDISTARANVVNLNEQVLGICLVGNFTSGSEPSSEQIDSVHKLCNFFINDYSDLSNINSWDNVAAHKDLPGQATTCPGDDWPSWKPKIISGVLRTTSGTVTFNSLTGSVDGSSLLQGQISTLQKTISHQKTQIDSMQMSLATVNGQLISLKEALHQREAEIARLKLQVTTPVPQQAVITQTPAPALPSSQADTTLTLLQAAFNLYKFIFEPRSVN